ncbi:extracellular solute-binding protein [Paenibacillus sp. MMS20-IR301]|uniref:extracellular solute-binding protein n=1 Tax=Paenibacillus sp. MMS20-IR301 TaxID=2895946 RepID=UPI0028F0D2B5|nr:extracellular solute-binding protein [Paenibacillus sp. MMS20-IR301]WNS46683.1 extracellular solute-binding protein [Paenibacillus sp. MMS20-IR301]
MKRNWRKTAGAAAGVLSLLAVTACGGQNQNAADAAANGSNQAAATASAAADAGTNSGTGTGAGTETLTVYLNDFDAVIGDMFEKKTGIKLNIVSGNGAEIMSRIEAEQGNPQWDVVWIDAMPSIYGLDAKEQLLTGWTPDNVAGLKDNYESLIPADGAYYPTGAHAAGIIVYNKDKISGTDIPASWEDLKNAAYKGRLGMADPAIAAPAYPFVASFFEDKGIDGGKEYFNSLMEQGLRVYPKNPQVVQALTSGEIEIAALQESNAYSMLDAGEPVELVWPEDGAPASVRVAAIQKDTEHADAAKQFVSFLLEPEVQQELIDSGDESYFEPSAEGANPKADRAADAKLNFTDAAWASGHEAEIKQWFADQAVQ